MKITPINGDIETEGTSFFYRGRELIVARAGNSNFKKDFRQRSKPYNDDIENDRMDEDISRKVMIQCIAKTILVGWKNFTDSEGTEFEYSFENAVSLLTDDDDCYTAILKFSSDIENYLVADEEKLKVK